MARLALAIVVIVLIPLGEYAAALVVFVVAALTDWIDGYWARRYGLVTQFGRIFDPFVDKVIIAGAFICLVGVPGSGAGSGRRSSTRGAGVSRQLSSGQYSIRMRVSLAP